MNVLGWCPTRRERRRAVVVAVVTVTALVIAVIAGVAALRTDDDPLAGERTAILTAADSAVTTLMTFGPDGPPQARRHTDELLTDPLRLEYRARGADVVLPGAQAAGLRMTGRVVGVGVDTTRATAASADDAARVLVFVDQEVEGPSGTETAPTARWALMRKVDGNWLLADLQQVGDVTR